MKEEDFGALYQSADESSLTAQGRFLRATQIPLVAIVVAGVGGAFAASVGPEDIFGLLAFVAFVAALAAEVFVVSQKPDQAWYEGRAAAESAKTLAWRFMVGGDPFPITLATGNADTRYLHRISAVLHDLNTIDLRPASGQQQIADEMRRIRGLSLDHRPALYESSEWRTSGPGTQRTQRDSFRR